MAELARTPRDSERALRRRFNDAIGYGPKKLDRIIRFGRLLRLAALRRADGLAAAAAELGYADQAHLTREVREPLGAHARRAARCSPPVVRKFKTAGGRPTNMQTMLPSRLSAVTLVTDDVMARRGFYEAPGWRTPLAPRDDYARMETAGAALSIWTTSEARDEIAEPLARGLRFPRLHARGGRRERRARRRGHRGRPRGGATVVGEAAYRRSAAARLFRRPGRHPVENAHPDTRIDERGVLRYD